ncbi:DUF397 domain-containing protein [Streptomyces oceani]|uniref:DUF397 domain-containing protein n=1 Tax=Streptomyces oceani TaxID=1075402 RepID=A0A1E7KN01_9ACTN|nr:DUF397 domain-containing protein [Streptomyces oceani]OEV05359.1 hypothetical protein AN216_03400 [Streptomyces oceani]
MSIETHTLTAPVLASVADWFKSSHSDNGGNCVEAADLTRTAYDGVAVRDSKDPNGPALMFTLEAFASFVTEARAGRYDA